MAEDARFGPDNVHPLSKMKTELIWEGKYDEYGNRRSVDVAGSAKPMQKIETVDMPRREVATRGEIEFSEGQTKRLNDFRNQCIAYRKSGLGISDITHKALMKLTDDISGLGNLLELNKK